MQPSSRNPGYSFDYSAWVVDSFLETLGRAPYFIERTYGIGRKDLRSKLISLFMHDQVSWRRMKYLLKSLKDPPDYLFDIAITRQDLRKYLTAVKTEVEDYLIDHHLLR